MSKEIEDKMSDLNKRVEELQSQVKEDMSVDEVAQVNEKVEQLLNEMVSILKNLD